MSETPMEDVSQPQKSQRKAQRAQRDKKGRVITYLAILFAAAFLLLLLSYLMQQRASEQTITDLTQSLTSVHSLQNLVDVNAQLQSENEQLKQELAQAQGDLSQLETQLEEQSQQLEAMDYFRRIQAFYAAGAYRSARIVIEAFEESGLTDHLPTTAYYQNSDSSVLSPSVEYQKIYAALY